MERPKTIQKQITECRAYISNGLPEYLKNELRGQKRGLELELDKIKYDQKENRLAELIC